MALNLLQLWFDNGGFYGKLSPACVKTRTFVQGEFRVLRDEISMLSGFTLFLVLRMETPVFRENMISK